MLPRADVDHERHATARKVTSSGYKSGTWGPKPYSGRRYGMPNGVDGILEYEPQSRSLAVYLYELVVLAPSIVP